MSWCDRYIYPPAAIFPRNSEHRAAGENRGALRGAWWTHATRDFLWVGIVAVAALGIGVSVDRWGRATPLGLRYRPAAERLLNSADGLPSGQAINFATLEEVEALLRQPDVIVLDARPDVFFEMGHLPGAHNLSREKFDRDFARLEPRLRTAGRTLLVYCSDSDCEDSARVARSLQDRGLGPVWLYIGGIAEWEAAGRPLEVSP